jgi:hypothetical protein
MVAVLKNYLLFFQKLNIVRYVKVIFLVAILIVFYQQISIANLKLNNFPQLLNKAFTNSNYIYWAILLIIPNLFLEAYKWQLLTLTIQKKTLSAALKDTILGLMAGIVSPFMVGDFVGRSLNLEQSNIKKGLLANFFNSICQTYTAIILGFFSNTVLYFSNYSNHFIYIQFAFISLLFASIFGLFFVFNLNVFKVLRQKNRYFYSFFNQYDEISNYLRFKILMLSILRNLIFNFQFLFIYLAFDFQLPMVILLIGINLLLLIKTVGGGLNMIGDLSIRQIVNLYFFSKFGVSADIIFLATFMVWLLNIGLPVLGGFYYFIKPKPQK